MFGLVYQLVNFGGPKGAFSTKICLGSINCNCVTSIDKSKLIPGLSVYPNPTENYLVIDAIEGLQYELIDINGKSLIVGMKEENKVISIDLSNLSAGIYTLKVSNGKAVVSYQISHL